ncbi:MAG: hypothetical protein MHM6MM_001336 [Cercozoa sp. M6MM]
MAFLVLRQVLEGQEAALGRLRTELSMHGFCVVQLPDELAADALKVKDALKLAISRESRIENGVQVLHSNVRDGFSVGTCDRLPATARWPASLRSVAPSLALKLDKIVPQLVHSLGEEFFFGAPVKEATTTMRRGMLAPTRNVNSFALNKKQVDIPMMSSHEAKDRFGLFDAVCYKSGFHIHDDPSLIMTQHADPGLLSLSLCQSSPGLQFLRQDGEFRDAPLEANLGVVWLGQAAVRASEGRLPPGMHRVYNYDTEERRIAIWYELCERGQGENLETAASARKLGDPLMLRDVNTSLKSLGITEGFVLQLDDSVRPPKNTSTVVEDFSSFDEFVLGANQFEREDEKEFSLTICVPGKAPLKLEGVKACDSVGTVFERIRSHFGLPPGKMRFSYARRLLHSGVWYAQRQASADSASEQHVQAAAVPKSNNSFEGLGTFGLMP